VSFFFEKLFWVVDGDFNLDFSVDEIIFFDALGISSSGNTVVGLIGSWKSLRKIINKTEGVVEVE
jgi:hypothetical protein